MTVSWFYALFSLQWDVAFVSVRETEPLREWEKHYAGHLHDNTEYFIFDVFSF